MQQTAFYGCQKCESSFLQYNIDTETDSILCLEQCPSQFHTDNGVCVPQEDTLLYFHLFQPDSIRTIRRDVDLVWFGAKPEAFMNRGRYLTSSSELGLNNFNTGPQFFFGIWVMTDATSDILKIRDPEEKTMLTWGFHMEDEKIKQRLKMIGADSSEAVVERSTSKTTVWEFFGLSYSIFFDSTLIAMYYNNDLSSNEVVPLIFKDSTYNIHRLGSNFHGFMGDVFYSASPNFSLDEILEPSSRCQACTPVPVYEFTPLDLDTCPYGYTLQNDACRSCAVKSGSDTLYNCDKTCGENCVSCEESDPPKCTVCREKHEGKYCDRCRGNFLFPECVKCEKNFIGELCDRCLPPFTGPFCTTLVDNHVAIHRQLQDCEFPFTGDACDECVYPFEGGRCNRCVFPFDDPDNNCQSCQYPFTGSNCNLCVHPFTGANCDECQGKFVGVNCDVCQRGYEMPDCVNCKDGFTGFDCSECHSNLVGEDCDECAMNFTGSNCEICTDYWQLPDCDFCPQQYDQVTCDGCAPNWQGRNCNSCTERFFGPSCEECVPPFAGEMCNGCVFRFAGENWDQCANPFTGQDCTECLYPFTGTDCELCFAPFTGELCDQCTGNWAGEDCDQCRTNWRGPNCFDCPSNFAGSGCDRCAENFTGKNCNECVPHFKGDTCSECMAGYAEPDCAECAGHFYGKSWDKCPFNFRGPNCDVCSENFRGELCEICKNKFFGPQCDLCPINYSGQYCDQCAFNFQGDDCEICNRGFTGQDCSECLPGYSGEFCRNCHFSCDSCVSNKPTECSECNPGFEHYNFSFGEGFACVALEAFPSGARSRENYLFNIFASSSPSVHASGYGQSDKYIESGEANFEPIPIYNRGLYFDGSAQIQLHGINMGGEFTMGLWYKAEDLNTLFASVPHLESPQFYISKYESEEQTTMKLVLYGYSGQFYDGYSVPFLVDNVAYELELQWNLIAVQITVDYRNEDTFTNLNVLYNGDQPIIVLSLENDAYFQTSDADVHYFGYYDHADLPEGYVGFIGDIFYLSYPISSIEHLVQGSCSTCVACPVTASRYQCLNECAADDSSCFDSCVGEGETVCVSDCPVGSFDSNDDPDIIDCQPCLSNVASCRNGISEVVCDDPLWGQCEEDYGECDECTSNAVAHRNNPCQCNENYVALDSGICVCESGRHGETCNLLCIQGEIIDGVCVCFDRWMGLSCDEECSIKCKTCVRGESDICESCADNFTGSSCNVCITGFAGDDCQSTCINGETIGRECFCLQGYTDTEGVCIKNQCVDWCGICSQPSNLPTVKDCISCENDMFNTSMTDEYALCVPSCPSGFNPNDCTPPAGKGVIFTYDFNRPAESYENLSGNLFAQREAELEDQAPSGFPSIHRGIHFSHERPGIISVDDVILNHTFAIHSWVLLKSVHDMTLFGKLNLLQFGVTSKGSMTAGIPSPQRFSSQRHLFTNYVWAYLVYSLEISDDHSNINFFMDNTSVGSQVYQMQQVIDTLLSPIYIGGTKTNFEEITNWWDGFIYNFELRVLPHATSDDEFFSSGCSSGCWKVDLDYYEDEHGSVQRCDASCFNIGCAHSGPCQTSQCEAYFCHLCPDPECIACQTYDSCDPGACGPNAENDGNVCKCLHGMVRDTETGMCTSCTSTCATCIFDNVCEVCADGYLAYRPDRFEDFGTICLPSCPTGTPEIDGSCVYESKVFHYFDLFGRDTLNQSNGELSIFGVGAENPPLAIWGRGFYIDNSETSNGTYIQLDNLNLGPAFAVAMWFKADNFDCLWHSYSNFAENQTSFQITNLGEDVISKTVQWITRMLDDEIIYSYIEFDSQGALEEQWNFFAFSFELRSIDPDGTYEILATTIVNEIQMGIDTFKTRFYYVDEESQPVQIAAGEYSGFIGDFYIFNSEKTDYSWYLDGSLECVACFQCPVIQEHIVCLETCQGADSYCTYICEQKIEDVSNVYCIDDCPVGELSVAGVPGWYDCVPCLDGCLSCRYTWSCHTCDDPQCIQCPFYNTCELCKDNEPVQPGTDSCECPEHMNFDIDYGTCCDSHCISCDTTGLCLSCKPGYSGDICQTGCNGNGVAKNGRCDCNDGFAGRLCEIECPPIPNCLSCADYDPNICIKCWGNHRGEECEECLNSFAPPDCVTCLPGWFGEQCEIEWVNGKVMQKECVCNERYEGSETPGLCVLIPCQDGCQDCWITDSYADCMACEEGYHNVSPSKDYAYCMWDCPTGFIPATCSAGDLTRPAVAYNFNMPASDFTNKAYGGDILNAYLVTDGKSGIPAKNRGIYFDGAHDGRISIDGLVLNHTFSVNIWVYDMKQGYKALFNKNQQFTLAIDAQGKMTSKIANVNSLYGETATVFTPGFGVIPNNMWVNVVYSLEMEDGVNTQVEYFINNIMNLHETLSDEFLVDKATQTAYMGTELIDDTVLSHHHHGYIYDVNIYQTTHDPLVTNHLTSGCFTGCWTVEIDQFVDYDGIAHDCASSCTLGCVNEAPCNYECGYFPWCYLCNDTECAECTSYYDCQSCHRNSNTTGDSCECNDGYGRADIVDMCHECDPSCQSCQGSGPSQCTTCNPRNELAGLSYPSFCICTSGYYPDPTIDHCSPCSSPCVHCSGPSPDDCLSCGDNSHVDVNHNCVCNFGYYLDPHRDSCKKCHTTCGTCYGTSEKQCMSCYTNAVLLEDGSCSCKAGLNPSPDASNCILVCSETCTACKDYPWICTMCLDGTAPVNYSCGCLPGQVLIDYPNGDPCVSLATCHATCTSCFESVDPAACSSCHLNAHLRFDQFPSFCDCIEGYGPSPDSSLCLPLTLACAYECDSCNEGGQCLSCKPGAELNGSGGCQCKEGFTAMPDAAHCQLNCPAECNSCLMTNTDLCTSCKIDYKLTDLRNASDCVSLYAHCPPNCRCTIQDPDTCTGCVEGYRFEEGVCEKDIPCHKTCDSCDDVSMSDCITCYANAELKVAQSNGTVGFCDCLEGHLPTPDSSYCKPICHDSCKTCSGITEEDCLSCPQSSLLASMPPCQCVKACHSTCDECAGPGSEDCISCKENGQIYDGVSQGRWVCKPGYVFDTNLGKCQIPHNNAKFHEFVFDYCADSWVSNGVTLRGSSLDSTWQNPLSVHDRGVFLNNKTYFKVDGLIFSSQFALNAWLKSHDTGDATLFSTNSKGVWEDSAIVTFSWRLINQPKSETKKQDMVELRDWTNNETKLKMQVYDKSYCMMQWSNIAVSVTYDWDNNISTVSFYGVEKGKTALRQTLTIDQRFARSIDSYDVIGHRLSPKGEPSNEFFGFIYYFNIYNRPQDDFSRSMGTCRGDCIYDCGANGVCLNPCWISEFLAGVKCQRCSISCDACMDDGKTCYCE